MKNLLFITILLLSTFAISQNVKGIYGKTNWLSNWTNFKSKDTEYKSANIILAGTISTNTTLSRSNVYILIGDVYVTQNAVLNIEPGTLILGDSKTNGTLIITKGSKINALGDQLNPIVFTSNLPEGQRKPGDWGGVVLMGNSPINNLSSRLNHELEGQYNSFGGKNPEDNSGVLKYVRIEFAGKKDKNNNYIDGITLAGIGKKTSVENIQVSYCLGNSFGLYGVNSDSCKNLISFRSTRNDFNITDGSQVYLENLLSIRNPYITNSSDSKVLKITSFSERINFDSNKMKTFAKIKNLTSYREQEDQKGFTDGVAYLDEFSTFIIEKSIFSGLENGITLSDSIDEGYDYKTKFKFNDVQFNKCSSFINCAKTGLIVFLEQIAAEKQDALVQMTSENSNNIFNYIDFKKTPDFRSREVFNEIVNAN